MRVLHLLLFIGAPFFSFGQYRPAVLVLRDATVIDASRPAPVPHQTIVIREGLIIGVGADSKNLPDSAVVIDCKGKYVLPGLIDSHVHLATDPSGVDNRVHALQSLQEMLYSGVTTVRDMAGDARVLAGYARDANNNEITSPDIYYSALMAGPVFFSDPRTATSTKGGTNGDMSYMKAMADTTNVILAVAQARGSGATGIKLYANLPAAVVQKILSEAKKQHFPVWAHAWLQGAKPSDIVDAGAISISHAPLLIYEKMEKVPDAWKKGDSIFWDKNMPSLDDLFNRMKRQHTILDATLLTYKKWAASDSAMRWDYEIARRVATRAHAAGVLICAGTDTDQEQFVQDEMMLLVADAGFTPYEAIVAATRNSAAAINVGSRKGSVAAGMDADLLVLDKNPMAEIGNIKTVDMVVKGGRIFKK